MLQTGRLTHGGIMANYRCTAACRHCLYACAPDREAGYITPQTARMVSRLLHQGGCRSVHIGGGEPFLSFDGLLALIGELAQAGVALDYIETNGYWAGNRDTALVKLEKLGRAGVEALCISVDPFHAEYVPALRPVELARLCQEAGMGYFLWKQDFLPPLSRLPGAGPHTRRELEAALSTDYIRQTARQYGIGYGGRAINIEAEYLPNRPLESLLDNTPCKRLLSTDHFHVDLHGRFIPPGCTGIAIPLEEAAHGIPTGKYPALEALLQSGVAGLHRLGLKHGFSPTSFRPVAETCPANGLSAAGYPSSCALCFHLRHYLSGLPGFPELDPEHYRASLAWYSL